MLDARKQTRKAAEKAWVSLTDWWKNSTATTRLAAWDHRAQKHASIPPPSLSERIGRARYCLLLPRQINTLGDSPVSSAPPRVNAWVLEARDLVPPSGQAEVMEQPEPGAREEMGNVWMGGGEGEAPTAPWQGGWLGRGCIFEGSKLTCMFGKRSFIYKHQTISLWISYWAFS